MWIRLTKHQNQGGIVYRVQAVKSFRCAATREPRTAVVCHLGTIPADGLMQPHSQLRFWIDAEKALANSLRLSSDEKRRVRELLAVKVSRPRIAGVALPLMP